eukprot:3873860-Rhodomonas_salina.1
MFRRVFVDRFGVSTRRSDRNGWLTLMGGVSDSSWGVRSMFRTFESRSRLPGSHVSRYPSRNSEYNCRNSYSGNTQAG